MTTTIADARRDLRAARRRAAPEPVTAQAYLLLQGDPPAPPPPPPPATEVDDRAREVDAAKRADTQANLSKLGQRAWLLTGLPLLITLGISLAVALGSSSFSDRVHSALTQAAGAAAVLWLVLFAVSRLARSRNGLTGMLIGGDGRLSTSYFQAWIWTLVLVWAFLYFIAVLAIDGNDLLSQVTGNLNKDYLLLLGGPFLALVSAQQINSVKQQNGSLSKVETTGTAASDLVSDDRGRTDLVDMQYLLFNVVALAFFFVEFARNHGRLPDLDDGLIALTSAAALAYIARKAVASNAPGITSIVRADAGGPVRSGDTVLISGFNFVPPGAEAEEYLNRVRVRFGAVDTPVPPADGDPPADSGDLSLAVTNITGTEIRVTVPDLAVSARQQVQVVVVTAAGIETDPYPLAVVPQSLEVLPPARLTPGQPAALLLPGVPAGAVAHVTIGGTDQAVVVGADGRAAIQVPQVAGPSAEVDIRALDLSATLTLDIATAPRLDQAEREGPRLILTGSFPVGQGSWRLLVDGYEVEVPAAGLSDTAVMVDLARVPAAVRTGVRRVAAVDPDGRISEIRQADLSD